MAEVRIAHRFDCSEGTFWDKVFFNDEFNREMHLRHLQFQQWDVLERHDTDTEVRRTVLVTPKVSDLPSAVKSLIGDGLNYREEGVFDKRTRRYKLRVVPNVMADKLSVQGENWVDAISQSQCSRVFQAQVVVKVFGVGSIIEKKIIADLQMSYNAGAAFTTAYLKREGLVGV